MPTVKSSDAEIYYEIHGEGPPILLVSGLNGVMSYWKPMLPILTTEFTVVLHDHRGTGKSSPKLVSSVEQMAQDVIAVMEAANIESAFYLGHSTGGAIGQVLAIDNPERIRGLVLSSTWARSDTYFRRVFEVRKELLKLPSPDIYIKASSLFMYPDWWINEHRAWLDEADVAAKKVFPDPQIVSSRIDAIVAFDRQAQVHRIRVPTLVICAKDDLLTPAYFSKSLAQRIPGARLHLIERGGHAAAVTVQEEFLRPVMSFLSELKTTP